MKLDAKHRIRQFLVTATIALVAAAAANGAELDRTIDLQVQDLSLAEALDRVALQSGVDITVVGKHDLRVSCSFSNFPLLAAVREVLGAESYVLAGPRAPRNGQGPPVLTVILGDDGLPAGNRVPGRESTPSKQGMDLARDLDSPADVGTLVEMLRAQNPDLGEKLDDLITNGSPDEKAEIVAMLEESGQEAIRMILAAYEEPPVER